MLVIVQIRAMEENITCLLIDDDADDQELFQLALKQVLPQVNCTFASSGPEAIDILKNNRMTVPGYIFMDWHMPFMDASECIPLLRNAADLHRTSIFILSGIQPRITQELIDELGIKEILRKQTSIELLSGELLKAIKKTG